jgi:hypothetical protein
MTLRSCLVLALIAGLLGALIGGALPRNASGAQVVPSSARADGAPERKCKAERAEFASVKAQMAICVTYRGRGPIPESEASRVPETPENDPESLDLRLPSAEEIRRNRELLDRYSEAVIVQHYDGTTGVYKPDEWPIDGEGYIVARKLEDGTLGWYAGADAGARSDPAAFRPWEPNIDPLPVMRREPDGTITFDGKPASPSVQRMFGGKLQQ